LTEYIVMLHKFLKKKKIELKNFVKSSSLTNTPGILNMSSTATKMSCPVCKSAGKPESVYTSHFTKSEPGPNGTIVCPTLLAQECGYCHEKGHTPKFCPKIKARDARRRTPFCGVCKAAGKPEADYTSHFTKSEPGPNGTVVCPTLLEQECRYCHKKGHTPKFCPKIKARDAHSQHQQQQVPYTASYRSSQQHHGISANQARQTRRVAAVSDEQYEYQTHCNRVASSDTLSSRFPGLSHGREPVYRNTPVDMEFLTYFMSRPGNNPCDTSPTPEVHHELQQQQHDEEFVSVWAQRSCAYTDEELDFADKEMELEAEFQSDMDAYFSDSDSSHSSMPSLVSVSSDEC
jgi:hypothetical protein